MKNNYFCLKKNHLFMLFFVLLLFAVFFISKRINNNPKTTQSKAVYGGEYATLSEFPYFVTLTWNRPDKPFYKNVFCGGALLNSNWVVTAQHCVNGFVREAQALQDDEYKLSLRSVSGITPTPKPKITYKDIKVYANFINFDYAVSAPQSNIVKKENLGTDMVLLELQYPIKIPKYPQLPEDDKYYKVEQSFTFMGFGGYLKKTYIETVFSEIQNIHDPLSTRLKKAIHNIKGVGTFYFTSKDQHSSFCKGDSGGPAIVRDEKKDIIIGVISSGVGCGENVENKFTKIKYLLSLSEIKRTINPTPTKTK